MMRRASEPPVASPRAEEQVTRHGIQGLWLATLRRPWRSLALVPLGEGCSVVDLAQGLAALAQTYGGRPLETRAAVGLTLEGVAPLLDQIRRTHEAPPDDHGRPAQVVVALDSPAANPIAVPVALAADAVVLIAELGKTEVASARATVEMLDRDRILGAVAVRGSR